IPLVATEPAARAEGGQRGPASLLASGSVDLAAGSVTVPLHQGRMRSGETVWFVLLDTDDKGQADALGINYAPKLTFAEIGKAVRTARLDAGYTLVFDAGKVDFKPERKVVPGKAPHFFPPQAAQPGSVGDAQYSPLVKIENAGGHIYNAPVVAFDVAPAALNAFCKGSPDHRVVHDRVVAICPETGKVTLSLATGFSAGRPVLYTSTDANDPLPAALEASTFATALREIKVGPEISPFSPLERIYAFVNGPTGIDHPMRQGLDSALSDGRAPLNVMGSIPTVSSRYSPLWDINAAVWTPKAIAAGARSRQTDEHAILGLVQSGYLSGPDGKGFGSTGFIVNCPVVYRIQ
ncbi:MAG: hypothetical protein AB7O57_05630, partial [Hyphomicrobiaceae bacterium]